MALIRFLIDALYYVYRIFLAPRDPTLVREACAVRWLGYVVCTPGTARMAALLFFAIAWHFVLLALQCGRRDRVRLFAHFGSWSVCCACCVRRWPI